jgi:hypothetical protein
MFTIPNDLESEALVELRQKDQDAMITILKDSHIFSLEVMDQINTIRDGGEFKGNVQITPHGKGIEIIIRIPLQFSFVNISNPILKNIKPTQKKVIHKINNIQKNEARNSSWGGVNDVIPVPGLAF